MTTVRRLLPDPLTDADPVCVAGTALGFTCWQTPHWSTFYGCLLCADHEAHFRQVISTALRELVAS